MSCNTMAQSDSKRTDWEAKVIPKKRSKDRKDRGEMQKSDTAAETLSVFVI